jgi:hypothetical protein
VKINHTQKSPCIFLAQQTSPTFRRHEDSIFFGAGFGCESNAVPDTAEENMKLCILAEWRATLFRLLAAAALWSVAASAPAHHSFAMFDPQHPVRIEGTVKSWEFTNPHSWLILMVMQGDTAIEYSIEGASVSTLIRQGFGPHTFSPGEKITVTFSPLKSGAIGGAFVKAVKADGTILTQSSTPN